MTRFRYENAPLEGAHKKDTQMDATPFPEKKLEGPTQTALGYRQESTNQATQEEIEQLWKAINGSKQHQETQAQREGKPTYDEPHGKR